MKLISYFHVMRNAFYLIRRIERLKKTDQSKSDFQISQNEASEENIKYLQGFISNPSKLIDFKQYLYFIMCPSLCFQFSYPKTMSIRKKWVLKRFLEGIVVLAMMGFVWYEQLQPNLAASYELIKDCKSNIDFLLKVIKIVIKVCIPNIYIWICLFILVFQCALNIIAELTYFADRQFYQSWWNCKNQAEYWQQWNTITHNWFIRHLYYPLLRVGFSRELANFSVFLVSALLHELFISGGLGIISYITSVSYTHLRAHETRHDLVCRLLLEKKKKNSYHLLH
eukprot:TRINITY_DN10353_c0_g1_i1.p1 TRINITY_DN10353_c0_g1~~TRINITY_DN10353_c0_g1_i1.p1  ORF type:complete len:282 (-),score=26.23 TRINITY_DN10353_c0_g1_i1:23-868(-)